MKNQYKQWQGWPIQHQNQNCRSNWLDKHTGLLISFVIIAGAVFCFLCGVIVGLIQPPLYNWAMRLLGLG